MNWETERAWPAPSLPLLLASFRLADSWPKFGIPPTVAETSQPKRTRPGKEIDTQILERGVQMKRLFLGSVALVALGLGTPAAFAAEMRVPPPAPAPAPAYTWSGCYVGASAGESWGRSQHFTTAGSTLNNPASALNILPAGAPITDSFDVSGFIGGGTLGCNWQWGAWVFGIEGDGSATNKSGQQFEAALVPVGGVARAAWISETQERWLV